MGYVDLDSKGIAGIEKYLDDQGALYTASLADGSGQTASPAQISADTRVQHALTDELAKAVAKFKAIAAGGIVIDITTGEIIALVSLPDFNPNQEDKKFRKEQANMMTSGVFELGSVIKAVTFAMAFDYGVTDLKGKYDARFPLVIGNASISDYHAQRRVLTVPEIFTNSSNIGTARMALDVGIEGHQEFLRRVGFFDRLTTEVPESAKPLLPKHWSKLATATAAFGHGFAVQPLQGISVIGGLLNNGVMTAPTFLKREVAEAEVLAKRIVKPETSEKMRYLFRLNVTRGNGLQGRCHRLPGGGQDRHGGEGCRRTLRARQIAEFLHRRLPDGQSAAMPLSSCWTSQKPRRKPMALPRRAGTRCRRLARSLSGLRRFSVSGRCLRRKISRSWQSLPKPQRRMVERNERHAGKTGGNRRGFARSRGFTAGCRI